MRHLDLNNRRHASLPQAGLKSTEALKAGAARFNVESAMGAPKDGAGACGGRGRMLML